MKKSNLIRLSAKYFYEKNDEEKGKIEVDMEGIVDYYYTAGRLSELMYLLDHSCLGIWLAHTMSKLPEITRSQSATGLSNIIRHKSRVLKWGQSGII